MKHAFGWIVLLATTLSASGQLGLSAHRAPAKRRAVTPPSALPSCGGSARPGWQLVFCDEFNEAVLNERNYWNPAGTWEMLGGGTHGAGEFRELQYYTRSNKDYNTKCGKGGQNYVQSNGTLKIVTKQEAGSYEVWYWDDAHKTPDNPGGFYTQCESFQYTSGWIDTPQTFLYGYFETRVRIPDGGHVMWPAFWLWGSEGEGTYREIDIFEFGACQAAENTAGFNMHISRELDNGYVQNPVSALNSYPAFYTVPGGAGTLAEFHTYAVKWSPNSVIWYVDDVEAYRIVQHTPHRDMQLIANMAIASWCNPAGNPAGLTANAFPYEFEIEFIRVYQSLEEELLWQWGNDGSTGSIGGWNLHPEDQFITGDFDADGREEVLAVGTNGWSKVLGFDEGEWVGAWHNGGSGAIGGWYLDPGDRFIAGDFDADGRDEILAIAVNGWSKVLELDGPEWNGLWHNNGAGVIAGWLFNPGDRFLAADFDDDGRDDVLAVATNGWSKVFAFDGANWQDRWHNAGAGRIAGWFLNAGDRFVAGDFDQDGREEVLAIATNGWSKVLEYDSANWRDAWHNGGGGTIAGWYVHPGDQFLTGNFDHDSGDELLAISDAGWSKLLAFDNGSWKDVWHNDGARTLHLWHMQSTDRYFGADADGDGEQNLLAIGTNGWVHLLQRKSILQF